MVLVNRVPEDGTPLPLDRVIAMLVHLARKPRRIAPAVLFALLESTHRMVCPVNLVNLVPSLQILVLQNVFHVH